MRRSLILLAALALALGLGIRPAAADLVYALTLSGCSGDCGPGPFGTIDLHQVDPGTVTVTETLAPGVLFVRTGGPHEALGFNISGDPGIAIAGLTPGFSYVGAASLAPFGSFDYALACSGCGNGGSSPLAGPLSLTLSRSDHGALSIDDFMANSGSYFFASDVLSNGNTGNVAALAGTPHIISEPPLAYLVLLMAFVWRWIRKRHRTSKILTTAGKADILDNHLN